MKQLRVILPIVFMCISFTASTQIEDRQLVFNPQNVEASIEQIDINGDGLLDVHLLQGGGFEAYINKGDFQFTSKGVFEFDRNINPPTSDRYTFIDVDGDGDKDVIVSGCFDCGSGDLHWFENTDGTSFTFVDEIFDEFGSLGLPRFIVEDYDGDGDEDFVLLSSDFGDLEMRLFDNSSSGFTVIDTRVVEDLSFGATTEVDQNNDGINEIIFGAGNDLAHVYVENGSIADPIFLDNGNSKIQHIDIDNDGNNDIVFQSGSNLNAMLGNGTSYDEIIEVFSGATCETGYYLHDYDKDGLLDILHGNCSDDGLYWKKGDPMDFGVSMKLTNIGFQLFNFSMADFNNDSMGDLVVRGDDSFLGIIDINNFRFTHVIASQQAINHKRSLDVDGDPDVEINIFFDNWAGVIDPQNDEYQGVTTLFNNNFRDRITDVSYFDFDGDNDKDMFVLFDTNETSGEDTTMIWLENNNMTFSNPQAIYTELNDGGAFTHADYDQDGDEDIAIFSLFNANEYLENMGDGTFEQRQILGGTSWNAINVDIDQDGWMDIVSYSAVGRAYYFRNDTEGGFESRVNIGDITDPRTCAVGDLDNSGTPEIICGNFNFIKGYQFENGDFVEVFSIPGFYGGLAIGDPNGDGIQDIITGEYTDYLQHDGNWEFTEIAPDGDHEYSSMEVIDLNGDSFRDMIGYELDAFEGGIYIHSNIELVTEQDSDMDGFTASEDCDDNNPQINPDQTEIVYNGIDDDCDPTTLDDDLDQDGFALADDCDDASANVNPDALEIAYNGIDDDCDPTTFDDDLDQDGFVLADDCDDASANVNPDAVEIPNNGIDEDCDGMDLMTSLHSIAETTINIFPNPVKETIYLDIDGDLNYQVSFYAIDGRQLLNEFNITSLDITTIVSGIYLLELRDISSGEKIVERIVVDR